MRYSRVQESTADQAALNYLRHADLPAEGLASFLGELASQQLLPASQQSQYVRTHPLTHDRIKAIRNSLADGKDSENRQIPPEWVADHKRMIAKLRAYLHPERIDPLAEPASASTPRLYAAAIAAYRTEEYDEAHQHLARLIDREPDNPYFHELKGQLLVDAGKVDKALAPYRKAAGLLPDAPLIRTALAHALIAAGKQTDTQKLRQAVNHLEAALKHTKRNPRIHRLLATAYGRLGKAGRASLHLAEEAFLQNRFADARQHALSARHKLASDSAQRQRASDLLHFSKQAAQQKDNEEG